MGFFGVCFGRACTGVFAGVVAGVVAGVLAGLVSGVLAGLVAGLVAGVVAGVVGARVVAGVGERARVGVVTPGSSRCEPALAGESRLGLEARAGSATTEVCLSWFGT